MTSCHSSHVGDRDTTVARVLLDEREYVGDAYRTSVSKVDALPGESALETPRQAADTEDVDLPMRFGLERALDLALWLDLYKPVLKLS